MYPYLLKIYGKNQTFINHFAYILYFYFTLSAKSKLLQNVLLFFNLKYQIKQDRASRHTHFYQKKNDIFMPFSHYFVKKITFHFISL